MLLDSRYVRIPLIFVACCVSMDAPTHSAKPVTTEKRAAHIAEQAFLKHTKHRITRYSIRLIEKNSSEWMYSIDGRGEFARPGYNWIVLINTSSGKTLVQDGE